MDQTLLQPQTVPLQLPGTLTPQASFNNIGTPRAPPVPYPAAATTVPDQGLMASYNDRDAGCLLGTCKVQLKNGSIVMVENLIKGDIVCTGISPKTYGRVKCIVRNQVVTGKLEVVRLSDHCVLTPWHPVRSLRASISATTTATNITTATARSTLESDNIHSNDNKWKFPIDLNSSETILCQYVYSLLIDSMHTTDEVNSSDIFISHRYNTTTINNMKNSKYATGIIVDGIYEAIALAHGIKNDDVAEHEFFGTTNIVSAISVLPGYDDGVVTILPGWMTRDSVTDRVVGIDAKMVSVEDKMVVDMSDDDVDDLMM